MKTLFLIDASAHIYRSFHVKLDEGSPDKDYMQVPLVFGRILTRLLKDYQPDYMAVCFDPVGPSFREGLFPKYKAHRPPCPDALIEQMPFVRKVIESMGLPIYEAPGFEADDVIGTLTKQAVDAGLAVTIVANDKDMLQLVQTVGARGHETDLVSVLRTVGGPDEFWGAEKVKTYLGVSPKQVTDYLALCGDASDGVPGAKGIGAEGARVLLRKYVNLHGVLSLRDYVTNKGYRKALRDVEGIQLSKKLVTIRTDAPVTLDLALCETRQKSGVPEKGLFS